MPDEPEALGLLALLLLQDARRETRVAADGSLVLLEDQDRTRWDRARIDEGLHVLERASALGAVGPVPAAGRDRGRPQPGAHGGGHRLARDRGALRRPRRG